METEKAPFVTNNEVRADTIYFIQQETHWIEERFLSLESRYASQENEFGKRLAEVADLVSSLEQQLNEASISSESRLKVLEIYQKVEDFRKKIAGIQQQSEDSTQAAQWMCKYRNSLIAYASEVVFDVSQGGIRIREEDLQTSAEYYRLFQKDVYVYLKWIGHYLGMGGMTPKTLEKKWLALPIEYRFYIKAFTAIKENKVRQADRSEVSKDALQMIVRYFNRFLIGRENQEI